MFQHNLIHTGYSAVNGPTNNHTLWSTTISTWGYMRSGASVVNGLVYQGSTDYKVYVFNASTGNQVWTFNTNGPILLQLLQ